MNKDTKNFKSRFERWKNGESYWDIVGRPLPTQAKQKPLTEEERAELDGYIDNISNYSSGKTDDSYYRYMEQLAKSKAKEWNQDENRTLLEMLNDNTYNYRAMYDKYGGDDTEHEGHFTDEFKTAYHPTFSNQSMYSRKKSQYNPAGIEGGIWTEDTGDYYLNDRTWSPGFNKEATDRYLKYAENLSPFLSYGIQSKYGRPIGYQDGKDDSLYNATIDMYKRNLRNAQENGDSHQSAEYRTLQSMFESQYGQSDLATKQNNYGGIKKPGSDTEYATFKDIDDYVNKHSDLLRRKYGKALRAETLDDYLDAMEAGGYYDLDHKDHYRKTMHDMKKASKWIREYNQRPNDYVRRRGPEKIQLPRVQDMKRVQFEPAFKLQKVSTRK